MTDKILSFSKVRKARDKAGKSARANENAARFGQTKVQKTLQKTQAEKAQRAFNNHRLDE